MPIGGVVAGGKPGSWNWPRLLAAAAWTWSDPAEQAGTNEHGHVPGSVRAGSMP